MKPARVGRVLLTAVPLVFLGIFFFWPVGAILGRGLFGHGSAGFGAIRDVVADAGLRHVIAFTVEQAALSTLITLAVGLPAAGVLSRYQFAGRGLARALVTIPFVLPTIVVATAFRSLGIEGSLFAIVAAHCFFNAGVVIRVVGAAWEQLDPREEDAARMLGAGLARTLLSVTLPALRPAIVAAASIVFLFCFTSFGVILVLGGPRFATIETEIYRQTAILLDLRAAAALSVIQIVAVLTALGIAGAMAGRTRRSLRAASRRPLPERGRSRVLVVAAVAPVVLLVAVPIGELVRRSFAHGANGFAHLGDTPVGLAGSPLDAIRTSLAIAGVATVLAVGLGLALATALTRPPDPHSRRPRGPRRVARFGEIGVMLPLGVSAVTVGFGFLIVFDTPPFDLRTSWWIIPIAHAIVALPFVVRAIIPVLRSIDPHQREAAALLGARPARVWREIDLPVVARAAGIAAAFAFAISLGEFGATLFIVRPETTTVPVAIFRFLGRPGAANVDQAMALATILMIMAALVALIGDRVHARGGIT